MSNLKRRYEDLHPPQSDCPAIGITKDVAEMLKVNGEQPVVIFAVDKNGDMQAYTPPSTRSEHEPHSECRHFPLHADNLEFTKTLTLFATSNPKFCWINGNGALQCIEW